MIHIMTLYNNSIMAGSGANFEMTLDYVSAITTATVGRLLVASVRTNA